MNDLAAKLELIQFTDNSLVLVDNIWESEGQTFVGRHFWLLLLLQTKEARLPGESGAFAFNLTGTC